MVRRCRIAGVQIALRNFHNDKYKLAAGVTLISLGLLSRQHLPIFTDEEALWRDTVIRNPRAVIAQNDLGLVLYGQLQYRRAIECFDQALQANPNFVEGHYNLGLLLTELGQYPKAAAQMEDALQLAPNFAKAENGLGFALLQLGQTDQAATHFQRVLKFDPDYVDAHNNLGKIQMSRGQLAEAEAHFRRVLQTHPTDFAAHENLGVALFQQHRFEEAVTEFREAARLKPEDPEPHKNLADILDAQHRLSEAQQERVLATSFAEHLGETHFRIATALQADNDPDGAIKHLRKSITVRPKNAEAYLALGKLLVEQNRLAEAVAALREGTEAVPDDLRLVNELARLQAASPAQTSHCKPRTASDLTRACSVRTSGNSLPDARRGTSIPQAWKGVTRSLWIFSLAARNADNTW